jgi:nitrate reductase gamma subunit
MPRSAAKQSEEPDPMSNSDFLFRVWPYLALAVFGLGLVVRYLRTLPRLDDVMTELSEGWSSFGAGKVLKGALALLALGHIVAFLYPGAILSWNGSRDRLYLLEGLGIVVGVVALFNWGRLMLRQLEARHPSRLGDVADTIFVALVLVGLLTGLGTAIAYRWASSWSAATVTPYLGSLLSGNPQTAYATTLPFLVQLHVFAGFAALAAFPLTRLAPFVVVSVHRALMVLGRPLAGVGKTAEDFLRRHNPGAIIWPKED